MEKVKLQDGTFRYRESYRLDNKKINGPSFKRITDAKTWKARIETEKFAKLAQGKNYFEVQNVLFADYANKWLVNYVLAHCVFRTYQGYDSYLRAHLLPRYGKMYLRDINEDHGLELMNSLKKTHTTKGILNIWQVMKTILLRARREKLILCDPWENIQRPKQDIRQDAFWIRDKIT